MKNQTALALTLIACGGGVLVGRALPRDPPRDLRAVTRPAASTIVVPSRQAGCSAERGELARTKAQLALCMTLLPRNSAVEAPTDTAVETPVEPLADTAVETPDDLAERQRVRRNIDALKTPGELIIVRHSNGALGYYPADQQIDDGIIVARRLPSGELAHYDPDAGLPRTDPSAFRVPPPGSPLAMPKTERGPDGLIYINGELADPAVQRWFALPPR